MLKSKPCIIKNKTCGNIKVEIKHQTNYNINTYDQIIKPRKSAVLSKMEGRVTMTVFQEVDGINGSMKRICQKRYKKKFSGHTFVFEQEEARQIVVDNISCSTRL